MNLMKILKRLLVPLISKIFFNFRFSNCYNLLNLLTCSQNVKITNDPNNGELTKDGITDKIFNGSKNILDKVLSPSKEKSSFPKVCALNFIIIFNKLNIIF